MRVVPVAKIDYITASGAYAELHAGSDRSVIRESMQQLEERLDPERFIRVHRWSIVRLDLIEAVLRSEGSEYEVQLKGGVRLRVGRSRREALERRLGRITEPASPPAARRPRQLTSHSLRRRHRLRIAPLRLAVRRAERERRLARARHAGEHS